MRCVARDLLDHFVQYDEINDESSTRSCIINPALKLTAHQKSEKLVYSKNYMGDRLEISAVIQGPG